MRRVLASVPCLNLSLTGVFYPVLALAGGVPSGCSSQGRQRAEALAERSVEIAQAMVPLAGALARGGGGRAIEARQAAIQAREERRVLFDVLQAGWSDSTFSAKWARLEAEEEACEEDDLTVVGTADRFVDFVGL